MQCELEPPLAEGLGVFCALFGGLAVGAPCICPVCVGVLCFFF